MVAPLAQNLPSYLRDTANRRTGEQTTASWTDGMNDSGSNAPGVGINTSDYDPKADDWSRDVRDPQVSQQLGNGSGDGAAGIGAVGVEIINGADVNDKASFVQAAAATAPDADLITGVVNRTGKTVPQDSWAWGTKTTA